MCLFTLWLLLIQYEWFLNISLLFHTCCNFSITVMISVFHFVHFSFFYSSLSFSRASFLKQKKNNSVKFKKISLGKQHQNKNKRKKMWFDLKTNINLYLLYIFFFNSSHFLNDSRFVRIKLVFLYANERLCVWQQHLANR